MKDKSIELIPHCQNCRVKLIVTQFSDKVVRFLCPICKGKLFAKMGEHGLEKVKHYSEFFEI